MDQERIPARQEKGLGSKRLTMSSAASDGRGREQNLMIYPRMNDWTHWHGEVCGKVGRCNGRTTFAFDIIDTDEAAWFCQVSEANGSSVG